MAIVLTKEKERTTKNGATHPYMAHDKDATLLTENDAVTAATTQVTADVGSAPHEYNAQRLSDKAWRISFQYKPTTLSTPTAPAAGSVEDGFEFSLPRIETAVPYATTKYPSSAPDLDALVGLQEADGAGVFVHYQPVVPPQKIWKRYHIASGSYDQAYIDIVRQACGTLNSAIFKTLPIRELCLVRATGQRRDDDSVSLYFGWAWEKPRTETIGTESVTFSPYDRVIVYKDWEVEVVGGVADIMPKVRWVYVQRMLPEYDHNNLALP